MKQILIIIFGMMAGFSITGQTVRIPSFGTDTTFEVMTWNLQGFPKNGQTTVDYVKQIIESLDVDLVAVQELDDVYAFEQMVAEMDSYTGYVAPGGSYGLGYICRKDKIQIHDVYEIYASDSYWRPFPRAPLVIELNYQNERIIIINNHLKCCGDGILEMNNEDDEENRRYVASYLLKDYIEANFADQNVIVTGDLNDELSDERANNVFQTIIDDSGNFRFADMEIAFGPSSGWSYPAWPSHLDHLLITDELFDEEENNASSVQTIKAEDFMPGGWYDYETNITDHRPVAMKLNMNLKLGIPGSQLSAGALSNHPNPFSVTTNFTFRIQYDELTFEVVNIYGQIVFSVELPAGSSSVSWNAEGIPPGVYFARIFSNGECLSSRTVVLNH